MTNFVNGLYYSKQKLIILYSPIYKRYLFTGVKMAIPDYQTFMLPLLQLAEDCEEHKLTDAIDALSNKFNLTDEEKEALLPSGTQTIVYNRIGWARTYLHKAGLLNIPKRGYLQITDRGKEMLNQQPKEINVNTLNQYTEFKSFRAAHKDKVVNKVKEEAYNFGTPEEALEYGYQRINENLSEELLKTVKSCSSVFFERLVIDLLVKMGYGGSRKEAGEVLGKSSDGGIDGIIKEDKLGLDIIYVQAKRWENIVGRPEIQKFAGALLGQKARKGIFITTSGFTNDAVQYAKNLENKVILIDGLRLAELMIEYNLGVSVLSNYEVKGIDTDYFIED
jgi:restriction system protein